MKTIVDYAQLVKQQHALNISLAPVEADPSASSKDYAIGQHFILDGELYKAKTAIALGDALVLDTNYEAAGSIEAQIETLDAENQTLTNNVSVLAENGAVNILPNSGSCTLFETSNPNGSTLTENSDDSITVNVTELTTFRRFFANKFKEGTYKLTIGKNATAPWAIFLNNSPTALDTYKKLCRIEIGENEAEFTVTSADISTYPYIFVNQSCNVEAATYYPMIADVDYTGGYVPYAMTNRELTASTLKTKLFGNIAIDSLTLAAGASGDVKKNTANISYADLGLKAGSIKAVIFTWSTGHVCIPTQIYASGGNNIVLSLYNPSSSSVTVTQVDLQVFYTE